MSQEAISEQRRDGEITRGRIEPMDTRGCINGEGKLQGREKALLKQRSQREICRKG